jgi:hypothetical protein
MAGIERQIMKKYGLISLGSLVLANLVFAGDLSTTSPSLRLGDCVMFREGGAGLVLRTPTYWLKGVVARVSAERRLAGRCPVIGKSISAYTRSDWVRVAAAMPCVDNEADVREVDVMRVRMVVEEWETPWSNQHGTGGVISRAISRHSSDKRRAD